MSPAAVHPGVVNPVSAISAGLDQPITLVVGLALVGLLPFAVMSLTSFVKTSTVLHIARSAIGAQNIPSTTVIMALSAALTFLAMGPLTTRIGEQLTPILSAQPAPNTVDLVRTGFEAVAEPVRGFLVANSSPSELERFFLLAKKTRPAPQRDKVARTDFSVVIPAFMVSELIAAFTLGFAVYLPFLVVDIVVANILMALGMQMMNPTQVSLPFKLLLFVTANGWGLLSQTLVGGYQLP
jgi:type III secretion protein R